MAGYRYFVCPVEFNNDSNRFQVDCEPSDLFQLQDYALPAILESVTGWVRLNLHCPSSIWLHLFDLVKSNLKTLSAGLWESHIPMLSPQTTVRLYPFQIHSIALSSFASIMGPFGGFFASGFKRAFKIKVEM